MPVIVNVHGTFASGDEVGEKWWQDGSPFEKELAGYLEADGGELSFRRVHWSGANTETARRAAASDLLVELEALEKTGEPYCIIAHSHGGSAVLSALLGAACEGNELPNLQRWISVATPFVEFQKQKLLFSRLGRAGQALLIAAATYFLLTVVTSTLSLGFLWALPIWLLGALPCLSVYVVLWYRNRLDYRRYEGDNRAKFAKTFSDRWLGLWHRHDEAISSLKALGGLDRPIFASGFAVPFVAALAVFILPLFLWWLLSDAAAMTWVRDFHLARFDCATLEKIVSCEEPLTGGTLSIGAHYNLIITLVWEMFAGYVPWGKTSAAYIFFYLVLVPGVFCAVATLILLPILIIMAMGLSPILSIGLNKITWSQLKQTGFGGNVIGEEASGADPFPSLLEKSFVPLPPQLEADITKVSDAAAARALPKLRQAISQIAFSEGQAGLDTIDDFLSWQELIHTTYFSVPSFVMLLAYAISQENGFNARPAFKQQTGYRRAKKWYTKIVGGLS